MTVVKVEPSVVTTAARGEVVMAEPMAVMEPEPDMEASLPVTVAPADARGPVAEPATGAPEEEATEMASVVEKSEDCSWGDCHMSGLTGAVLSTVLDGGLGSLTVRATCLIRAVADAVAEVDVVAETGGIAGVAAERRSEAEHVANARLTAWREVADLSLGSGEGGTKGEEGEGGLHVDC